MKWFYWDIAKLIHLHIIYGCLHAAMAEPSSRDKDPGDHKAYSIYCLAL